MDVELGAQSSSHWLRDGMNKPERCAHESQHALDGKTSRHTSILHVPLIVVLVAWKCNWVVLRVLKPKELSQ